MKRILLRTMTTTKLLKHLRDIGPKCSDKDCNTPVPRKGWKCRKHYILKDAGKRMKASPAIDRAIAKYNLYANETGYQARFRKWRVKSQGGISV